MTTIIPFKNNMYKVELHKMDEDTFYNAIQLSKEKRRKLNIKKNRNTLYIEDTQTYMQESHEGDIQIVYEDNYCIAVNKKPYQLIHSDGNIQDTLQARVNFYLQQNNWPYHAQAVHRIDYETSGIVLFCKMPLLQNYYDQQFRNHTTIKQYIAIVEGKFPHKKIDIRNPIAKDRHQANKMRVGNTGKESWTHIDTIQTIQNETLLLATIHTGRKHQIRVHLSHLGYPIKNDPLYGHKKNQQALCLESHRLSFVQPLSQEVIDITIPVDSRFTPFSNTSLKNTKHKLNNKKKDASI